MQIYQRFYIKLKSFQSYLFFPFSHILPNHFTSCGNTLITSQCTIRFPCPRNRDRDYRIQVSGNTRSRKAGRYFPIPIAELESSLVQIQIAYLSDTTALIQRTDIGNVREIASKTGDDFIYQHCNCSTS